MRRTVGRWVMVGVCVVAVGGGAAGRAHAMRPRPMGTAEHDEMARLEELTQTAVGARDAAARERAMAALRAEKPPKPVEDATLEVPGPAAEDAARRARAALDGGGTAAVDWSVGTGVPGRAALERHSAPALLAELLSPVIVLLAAGWGVAYLALRPRAWEAAAVKTAGGAKVRKR